jgi:hypothetical protein
VLGRGLRIGADANRASRMALDSSSAHLSVDFFVGYHGIPRESVFKASLVCRPVHSLEIGAV